MSNPFEERAGILATSVQAEVRGQLDRKFEELRHEFEERFRKAFEEYRQRVLSNIEITHHLDVRDNASRITFDMKINREEIVNGL